jgi:ABC-type spermidine/putrescine transport system permease subunit II
LAADNSHEVRLENVDKLDKRVATAYLMPAVFTGASMCLTPIITDVSNWAFGDGFFHHTLPFKSWYFYNTKKHPAYEFTYLSLGAATYLNVFMNVSFKI